MDHPSRCESARTARTPRAATRIFFCLFLSLPPLSSLSHSFSLSLSLSLSRALCTDANETTADLRDIYVRFSRTLLLARHAFVDDDRVDVSSLVLFSLSLSLAPAPRSFFALTRERRGPSPSRFFALSPSLPPTLSLSLPPGAVSAPVHMRARPRKHETRIGGGGALERARLSPLMQNTHTHTCTSTYIHTYSLFSPVCAYARTRHVHVLALSQCESSTGSVYRVARKYLAD